VKLNDRDVFLQFGLETREEWDAGSAVARQRGVSEALGIPLLTRSN
jgi:hypothetical protein